MLSKDQQQNDAQARQDEARLLGANYKYAIQTRVMFFRTRKTDADG